MEYWNIIPGIRRIGENIILGIVTKIVFPGEYYVPFDLDIIHRKAAHKPPSDFSTKPSFHSFSLNGAR